MKRKSILSMLKMSAMVLAFSVLFYACSDEDDSSILLQDEDVTLSATNGDVIPGQYIVVLKPDIIDQVALRSIVDYIERNEIVKASSVSILEERSVNSDAIEFTYSDAIMGFSARLSDDELALLT